MGIKENSNEALQPLVEIARLVSDRDEQVLQEVLACVSDIQTYFSENSEQYEEHGFEKDDEGVLRRIGLVDILEKYQYVCERGWKDERDDFIYFLQELKGTKRYGLSVEEDWLEEDGDVAAWCSILDEKWKDKNYCMAAFDIESDSYVLFPCSMADLAMLKSLAEQSGNRIDLAKNM